MFVSSRQLHWNLLCNNSGSKRLFYSTSLRFASTQSRVIIKPPEELKPSYDVICIGGGHNGLISAAYLQKAGYSVCVLERRHIVGGAAITEEIVPGFKFSRASYLLSLLRRPYIISDLKLKEHGLKFYLREPYSSYTPISEKLWPEFPAKSLLLSNDPGLNTAEINKFSQKDAVAYFHYEHKMEKFVKAITHLLDSRPPNLHGESRGHLSNLKSLLPLLKAAQEIGVGNFPEFHEMMTGSASKILNRWFESEPLKATLATDALIGTMSGPNTAGTGYVLLHHIMGGIDGKPGAWAYAEGGMGAVSESIASSAAELGVSIFTNQEIDKITFISEENKYRATGVVTKSGQEIKATHAVLSNATPEVTFKQLVNSEEREKIFGQEFLKSIDSIDYESPVTKINVALSQLPNFSADPSPSNNHVGNPHKCTIHLNCESIAKLENSFETCHKMNQPSTRPLIEMVIPSSLDPTLAPKGAHVCLLFTQYTPYSPSNGSWEDETFKEKYAQAVFDVVEEYAPGFKRSVVGKEVLTPLDLEKTFGLTGGNIFHGAMKVDQLYWLRPIFSKECWFPQTPARGLYLCGSGCHPGGGVLGTPGYLAAKTFLSAKNH